MPDPQQGLNQPAQTDAACLMLPALTDLSESTRALYVNALVRSGIAGKLGVGYSTPSERDTLLTLGLAKIRECSSEIAALIPDFNKQLLASSSPNGRVNPPGDQEINDLIREAKMPVSEERKEPQKKVSDEQLKIFAEKFQLPVSDFTDADKIRLQKLFPSEKEGQKMFEPEHLKKIESILSILWRLPGGSSIDKTITSAELYHSATAGYRIKVGDTINGLLEPLAKVVDLASKLNLHEITPKSVVTMLNEQKIGNVISTLSPLLENQSYFRALEDYLRPRRDRDFGAGAQKLYIALQTTAKVSANGNILLFGGKSLLKSSQTALDFFTDLELNPIDVLVGPRESLTEDQVRLKSQTAQVDLITMAIEATSESNKKPIEGGVLKHPDGVPLSREEVMIKSAKADAALAGEQLRAMDTAKGSASPFESFYARDARSPAPGVFGQTFKEHFRFQASLAVSVSTASKSSDVDFSPLPIPLDELQKLPWKEYIASVKKDGEAEKVFLTDRESDGFKRLTAGFALYLLDKLQKNHPEIAQSKEEVGRFLNDPRLFSKLTDSERTELAVYILFGKIDSEMYRFPLSKKPPFGLVLSNEEVDSLARRTDQLTNLTNSLKNEWNVKRLNPKVAREIADNQKLFEFYSSAKNAEAVKSLTQRLLGSDDIVKESIRIQEPERIYAILENQSVFSEKAGELQQIFGKDGFREIFLRNNSQVGVVTTLVAKKDGLKSLTESLFLFGAVTNPNGTFNAESGVSLIAGAVKKSGKQLLEIELNDTKFQQLATFYCLNYFNSDKTESRQVEATSRLEKLIALSPKQLADSYDEHQKALAAGKANPAAKPKLI